MTRLLAQLAERRARYPKDLGSSPTFSTKHITCLSPVVGGLRVAMADLIRSDRFQPRRGRTRQPSQRLLGIALIVINDDNYINKS